MKKTTLSNEYISAFCLQISLLIHAGVGMSDGMHLMAEDEQNSSIKQLLLQMAEDLDTGKQLSEAMKETGAFPDYVIYMTEAGERTGRLEKAFRSMADYYEGQRQMQDRMKSAVAYPSILLVLVLVIIGILLIRILPIFKQVYEQLGGSMNGLAGGLFVFGQILKGALPVIAVILTIVFLAVIVIRCHGGLRSKTLEYFLCITAGFDVAKKISSSRFVAALSMGIMSGLATEDALELAASFQQKEPKAKQKYEQCRALIEEGNTLPQALKDTEFLEPVYCRMLALGEKSGTADNVIEEIARRKEEDAQGAIEKLVGKVEPTIVIMTSLLVGIILLAVMLPLMNIMASIG